MEGDDLKYLEKELMCLNFILTQHLVEKVSIESGLEVHKLREFLQIPAFPKIKI